MSLPLIYMGARHVLGWAAKAAAPPTRGLLGASPSAFSRRAPRQQYSILIEFDDGGPSVRTGANLNYTKAHALKLARAALKSQVGATRVCVESRPHPRIDWHHVKCWRVHRAPVFFQGSRR